MDHLSLVFILITCLSFLRTLIVLEVFSLFYVFFLILASCLVFTHFYFLAAVMFGIEGVWYPRRYGFICYNRAYILGNAIFLWSQRRNVVNNAFFSLSLSISVFISIKSLYMYLYTNKNLCVYTNSSLLFFFSFF